MVVDLTCTRNIFGSKGGLFFNPVNCLDLEHSFLPSSSGIILFSWYDFLINKEDSKKSHKLPKALYDFHRVVLYRSNNVIYRKIQMIDIVKQAWDIYMRFIQEDWIPYTLEFRNPACKSLTMLLCVWVKVTESNIYVKEKEKKNSKQFFRKLQWRLCLSETHILGWYAGPVFI